MKPARLASLVVCQIASLGIAGEARPGPTSPGAEDLLEQQLTQAKAIKPSEKQPGADQAFEKLKAEIAAKQQLWQKRLTEEQGVAPLLKGIPAQTLEHSKKIAADPAQIQSELKKGTSLPLLLSLASVRSPDVQAAYQNWRALVRQLEQASYLEDLLVQYRSFVRELDTVVGPQTHKPMEGVYPSALSLKGEMVDATVEVAWLNYLTSMRKALTETAKMYFEIQNAQSSLPILRESRTILEQMAKSSQAQMEAGEVSQADVLKANNELAMLDTKILTVERGRLNSIAKINTMLALAPAVEWGPVVDMDLSDNVPALAAALTEAQAHNQELLAANKSLDLMSLMVRMAEVEINPRAAGNYSQFAPSTGAEAGPTRNMMAVWPEKKEVSGSDAAMFSSNAAYLNELRVRVTQEQQMAKMAASRVEYTVKDAEYRLDKARRDRKTYTGTVVPQSKQANDSLKERYANNTVSLIEFLEARRGYLENSVMLQEARMSHYQALADLQDALGQTAANLLEH